MKTGLNCELAVGRWLEGRGYKIVRHRWHTPFGELDFLVRGPKGLVGLEIKSLKRADNLHHRVSRRQLQRLRRIQSFLCEKMGPTAFFVIYFKPDGKLHFLELSTIQG